MDVAARSQASSLHFSIGSVGADGMPSVTPIGTVFLRPDGTGFFFDAHTSALARNLALDPRVCVMAVDSSRAFWLRSLLAGRFTSAPGFRLYGTAGGLRPATAEELAAVGRRIRATRWLRGHRLLWNDFTHVRDLSFVSCRPVSYPVMTEHLWQSGKA